jgi:hypothetical protein
MALEEKVASKRRKKESVSWIGFVKVGRQTKQKARLQNYDKMLNDQKH